MGLRIFLVLLLLLQLHQFFPAAFPLHKVAALTTPTLQKVALLVRNGARDPSNTVDGKVTCESCELIPAGKEMSIQLGRFLHVRYGDRLNLGSRFDPTLVSFNAAQAERTIITGEGITAGMYPGALPLVKYSPMEGDEVLAPTRSWPSWLMRNAWEKDLHLDDAWVLEKLSKSDIKTLSSFLPPNNGDLCGISPSLCVFYVYDHCSVNISSGKLHPELQPLQAILEAVSKRFLWRLYGVNPQNNENAAIGPLAGPFLRKMATDFGSKTPGIRLSVHVAPMPTVFAMLSSLGLFDVKNTLTMSSPPIPQFGDVIAFEYSTTATEAYIQFYKFTTHSGDGSGSGDYVATLLPVKCTDEKGVVYSSDKSANGCTPEDMLRYLNSLGASDGQCYVTDTTLAEADCNGQGAPHADSLCYIYRSLCPGEQCGPIHNAIADPSRGFACEDSQLNKNTPYLVATIVAIAAPSILVGAIFGFYMSDCIKKLFGFGKRTLIA